jgi:hypothetical protein
MTVGARRGEQASGARVRRRRRVRGKGLVLRRAVRAADGSGGLAVDEDLEG